MTQTNWSGEDPNRNASRQSDRAARQAKARQQAHAAQTAGRGRRQV